METRLLRVFVLSAFLAIFRLTPAFALINCNTATVITSNQTLSDDFVRTTQGTDPCIKISGAGVVLNMGGHKLLCQSTTGICGPGVNIDSTGTVKNGEIDDSVGVNGPAQWNVGVQCQAVGGGGAFTDCTVSNMLVQAISDGMIGGKSVDTTVFEEADICIDSGDAVSSGASYSQIFCDANTTGFSVTGPSSGTFSLQRNYVRASAGTGIDILGGIAALTHNIIDAATPISGSGTLSENICSNATDCPNPTARGFSLTLDFN